MREIVHTQAGASTARARKMRKTSAAAQTDRRNYIRIENHKKRAWKQATSWYAEEKEKKDGFLAEHIAKEVKKNNGGFGPSARTIQRNVKMGLIGVSPNKQGPERKLPKFIFKTLCSAFESYVRINQVNGLGGDLSRGKLQKRVGAVVRDDGFSTQCLSRLIQYTAIDLLAGKVNKVKDRRVLWTTYENIKLWFENWTRDIVELGFATEDDKVEIDVAKDQLARILNLDDLPLS